MIKRRKCMFLVFILTVLIGGIFIIVIQNIDKSLEVKAFDVSDYQYYIDEFPSEKILGPISDRKSAKEKAESLLCEIYGDSIKSKKPYTVSFDEESQVWLIEGSLHKNYNGGVPHILIRKSDGKVLAVWHDK